MVGRWRLVVLNGVLYKGGSIKSRTVPAESRTLCDPGRRRSSRNEQGHPGAWGGQPSHLSCYGSRTRGVPAAVAVAASFVSGPENRRPPTSRFVTSPRALPSRACHEQCCATHAPFFDTKGLLGGPLGNDADQKLVKINRGGKKKSTAHHQKKPPCSQFREIYLPTSQEIRQPAYIRASSTNFPKFQIANIKPAKEIPSKQVQGRTLG